MGLKIAGNRVATLRYENHPRFCASISFLTHGEIHLSLLFARLAPSSVELQTAELLQNS